MYTSRHAVAVLFATVFLPALFFSRTSSAQNNSPANNLNLPNDLTINFKWQGDSLHSAWEPYAAMLIPIKLPNCPKQFYMQFDLGAPKTILYAGKINGIKAKYPNSIVQADSLTLTGQQLTIDLTNIQTKQIPLKVFGDSTINWASRNAINIIGTIGMDFIESKTIALNYPKKKMLIRENTPQELSKNTQFNNFMLMQSSILLPVNLMGKRTILFFDTGSSAFELLTNKENCMALARPNTQPKQSKVNSWGRMLTANTYATADSVAFGNKMLPINNVTYMEGASNSQVERMLKLGIGGMTGNKLFINSILILDTRNKKFAIVNP